MRIEHIALWAEDIELLKNFIYGILEPWQETDIIIPVKGV